MNEHELLIAIEPLIKTVRGLEQQIAALTLQTGPAGADGKDADPEQVAQALVKNHLEIIRGPRGDSALEINLDEVATALHQSDEFLEMVKGDPGKDADPNTVAALLVANYLDRIKGPVGDSIEPVVDYNRLTELLMNSKSFRQMVKGDAGQDGATVSAEDVAQCLVTKHADTLRGPAGKDGKSVDAEALKQQLAADFKVDKNFLASVTGPNGRTGAGIDVPIWQKGVYREHSIVQFELGRYYKALSDTADKPGTSPAWERIGTGGFAWKGLKTPDAVYEDGDLYVDSGSLFIYLGGKGRMAAKRGRDGKDGDTGPMGPAGKDAPFFVAAQFGHEKLSMALSDGEIIECEVNGIDALIEKTVDAQVEATLALYQKMDEQRGIPFRVYRHQWQSGTRYEVGDAVKNNRALWLCKKAGSADVLSQDNWERLTGSGSGGATVSQNMIDNLVINSIQSMGMTTWNGAYTEGDAVSKNTMVNDNGWLMISNKDTTDAAAPQALGVLKFYGDQLPDDDTGWTSQVNEQLRFLWVGTQYHLPIHYVISQIAFYIADVSGSISYDVFMVDMTGGKNKYVPISTNYPAQTTGWHYIPTGQIIVPKDSTISIVLQKTSRENISSGTGQWMYVENTQNPGIGVVGKLRNGSHIYFNAIDNASINQTTLLSTIGPGSTISAGGVTWEVTGSSVSGSVYDFEVVPASAYLSKNTLYVFTLSTYSSFSMPIWSVPDFYLADPDVMGMIRKDDDAIVYDENAYSIDIQYQEVTLSPDWDIMSPSDVVVPNVDAVQYPIMAPVPALLPASTASTYDPKGRITKLGDFDALYNAYQTNDAPLPDNFDLLRIRYVTYALSNGIETAIQFLDDQQNKIESEFIFSRVIEYDIKTDFLDSTNANGVVFSNYTLIMGQPIIGEITIEKMPSNHYFIRSTAQGHAIKGGKITTINERLEGVIDGITPAYFRYYNTLGVGTLKVIGNITGIQY